MWITDFFKNLIGKGGVESKGTGLVSDPVDLRDVPLSSVLGEKKVELPEEYRLPYILTITDQGRNPSCVGHSLCAIKEFLEKKEGNNITFDPEWLYAECKKIDGIPDTKGTFFRSGLDVLLKTGAKPTKQGQGEVSNYRIGGYAKLDDISPEGLKRAIYEIGPVLVGFHGSNEGWKTPYIRPPKAGEKVWGHAIAVTTGWNKDYFIAQNSWGENWGDNGYFYFDKNYMPFTGRAVLVDLPNNWKELLDKGDKPSHYFRTDLWLTNRGPEVVKLQDALRWLGTFPKEQESTGWFGTITKKAVIDFQKREGIYPQWGYFGPKTREKINQLIN